jgi:hypothetical protein
LPQSSTRAWAANVFEELVEFLYIQDTASLSEKQSWATNKDRNPYPAKFGALNAVPWQGEIYCGHNPWLFARLVDDLTVEVDESGNEQATWTERARPDMSWINHSADNE